MVLEFKLSNILDSVVNYPLSSLLYLHIRTSCLLLVLLLLCYSVHFYVIYCLMSVLKVELRAICLSQIIFIRLLQTIEVLAKVRNSFSLIHRNNIVYALSKLIFFLNVNSRHIYSSSRNVLSNPL